MCVIDYLIILVELAFAGLYGSSAFAGTALGTSFANVTGYSVMTGLLVPLDTLISQASGARQYEKIGIALQKGLVTTMIVSLIVLPVWFVSILFFFFFIFRKQKFFGIEKIVYKNLSWPIFIE